MMRAARLVMITTGLALVLTSVLLQNSKVNANAASSDTITLSPAIVNETIVPGLNSLQSIRVSNNSSASYKYSIYASPYAVNGEDYSPRFNLQPGFSNITAWFHIANSSGILTAASSVNINYSINIPNNIESGGFYAAVIVKVSPINSNAKSNIIGINQQLAEILYLQTPGPFNESGKLATWNFKFWQKPPINGVLRFENTGRIYYYTTITINYKNIIGSTRFTQNLVHIVLPGTTRKFNVSWPHSPGYGLYRVNGNIKFANKTINLPTRYVFVISSAAKLIVIAVVILIILISFIAGFRITKRKKP